MQYQAGYFFNSIFDLFLNKTGKDKVEKIVFQLGHFDLESSIDLTHANVDYISEIKTINNLLLRGLPTLPSTFIVDLFSTTFNKTKKVLSKTNEISHPFTDELISEEIFKAIHVIDPRINLKNQTEGLEDEAKATGAKGRRYDFKYSFFPEFLGHYFLQLIEENRTFGSIVFSSEIANQEAITQKFEKLILRNQDFVLEMPYVFQNQRGIAIELDDAPSETGYDYEIDQSKQDFCKQIFWAAPITVQTKKLAEIHNQLRPLIDFTYNEYFDTIAKNYRSPLYKTSDGIVAMQYSLSPIAIARIEKTILELLLSGNLSLNDKVWTIAVIEQDVPCAHLAFQDLMLHFENLFALKGEQKKLPEIKLSIYNTREFKDAKLNEIYAGDIKLIEKFDEKIEYDLLIDISILQRIGLINPLINSRAKKTVTIRSVRSISSAYGLMTDKSIEYLDFFSSRNEEKLKDDAKNALKYFLRNIFRKDSFLPGQLELINNALRHRNTLGSFPPGSGKTIAAQLAALLQPGLNFIVCPVNHLIANQISDLKKIRIDNTIALFDKTIFPTTAGQTLDKIENARTQFAFIGPNFLRNTEFRSALLDLELNKIFINYLIFDEAHCISEWGHQFVPAYQNIGLIKDSVFKNSIRQAVPIIALTGTAGYSTISDICRGFQIAPEHIVSTNYKQSDLSFKVLDTTSNQMNQEDGPEQIKQNIVNRKQAHLLIAAKDIFPDGLAGQKTLIYCQENNIKSGTYGKDSQELADKLSNNYEKLKIGTFIEDQQNWNIKTSLGDTINSLQNSDKFNKSELDVLVSTPDYGIGANNPDIRNILYFSPPTTFEAFIQQTYRAGIDGNKSLCAILSDKQKIPVPELSSLGKYYNENTIPFDKIPAYELILSKYKGKDKEIAVLEQLWNGFKACTSNYLEIITSQVEENFLVNIEMQFQPEKNAKRLYINDGEKTYGYIDLTDFSVGNNESQFERNLSFELLSFAASHVEKRKIENQKIQETLGQPLNVQNSDGIAKILANLSPGSFCEFVIPFFNDGLDKIYNLLNKKVSTTVFSKKVIRNQYQRSISGKDFIDYLELSNPLGKVGSYKDEIINLYSKSWAKKECELAISRLSRIGLIEDYQIDELKQQFVVRIRKSENQFYVNLLFALYDDFLLSEIAAEEKRNKANIDGSDLYQILIAHLDFFYKYVLPERFNSIESLYLFFSQIPENKQNTKELNKSANELMDRYFSAKFSNGYFSMVPKLNSLMGKQEDFTIIKGYLKFLGPLKENWKHLRKSTEIINKLKPDNFIPYLLDSYALLIGGEQDPDKIDQAFDQITRGFIKMRKAKNYDSENYQAEIQAFLDILFKNRPDLIENYEPIIWLRMHYMWLKDFNKKQVADE